MVERDLRQLGDPKKTSVFRHIKLGVMRVAREFRLYDGKQGRATDKKTVEEGLKDAEEAASVRDEDR